MAAGNPLTPAKAGAQAESDRTAMRTGVLSLDPGVRRDERRGRQNGSAMTPGRSLSQIIETIFQAPVPSL